MGHGYFTVVGFGIVVPVDLFLERIEENNLEQASEYARDTFDVEVHHEEQHRPVMNVFITTKGAIVSDTRGAAGSFTIVDPVEINRGHQDLQEFVAEFFPRTPIQLTVYSYEGA